MGILTRYAKLRVAHAPGMPGNFSPPSTSKEIAGDPGMHHGTCVAHVPRCMSGSLTRGGGENVPGILVACTTHNFTYLSRGPWRSYQVGTQERPSVTWLFVPTEWGKHRVSHMNMLKFLAFFCFSWIMTGWKLKASSLVSALATVGTV